MKRQLLNKKIILVLLLLFGMQFVNAQSFQLILNNNFQTNNGSTPQGHQRWTRTCILVTAAEMAAAGVGTSQQFNFLKLNQNVPANPGASGTVKIYLQNSSDATYLKSTTWTTLITGMTHVTNVPLTLPTTAGAYTINYNLSSFTYTGGSLYVAIEYSNPAGPLSGTTAHLVQAGATANYAVRNQATTVAAPAIMAATTSRPDLLMGFQYSNDITVTNVYTLGKVPIEYGAPTTIQANVSNVGTLPMTNINVALSISGTNSFANNVVIPSLAAGASQVVTFAPYSPTSLSTGDAVTVTILAAGDLNASNDVKIWSQNVTQNVYTYRNAALPNDGGVGFNGGTGDFVAKFNSNIGQNYPYNISNPQINEIKVDLTTSGQPYNLGIWDATGPGGTPGANLWTSPPLTTFVGSAFIAVPNVSVSGDYFVGVRQTGTVNVGFAYQAENPIRSGTFYYASPTGATNWTDFAPGSPFRFSIEVQVHIPIPPNCAINFAPANGSALSCNVPVINWQNGGGAPTVYDVYFSTNSANVSSLAPAALVSANQPGTSYNPGTLLSNTTYYWNIIPKNADGPAAGCAVQSFTTGTLPVCYCIPTYSGVICDGGISTVTFNTLSNSTACVAPGHQVFNPAGANTTTVQQGSTYNLSVTTTADDIISVWIDYNHSGGFDTTEWKQVTIASTMNVPSTVSITIPLTALTGNTLMRIRSRFINNNNFASDACNTFGSGSSKDFLINIAPPSPCAGTPNPGNTLASASTVCPGSTVNLSLQNATPGLGISFQWYNSNGIILGATNSTYTATITVADDFYADVTCGSNTGSSNLVSVGLSPFFNCYCIPVTSCAFPDIITNVTFAGINRTSTCDNTGGGYSSYTTAPNIGSVTVGSTNVIAVSTGGDVEGVAVWIDYNHSGTFDATELVLNGYIGTNPATYSGIVVIPGTALTGNTMMRVRCVFNEDPSILVGPCANSSFGETEDYLITIVPVITNSTLNLTCFIEAYFDGISQMAPVLSNQFEPTTAGACDSIDVELRDQVTYAVSYSTRAVLNQNGTASVVFGTSVVPGSYYVVVKHRNAIETWSANPVVMGASGSYNFSTSAAQAFGGNQIQISSSPVLFAFYSGDVVKDAGESVDLLDLTAVETDINNFVSGYFSTDVTGDGNTDILDSPLLENNISNFIFSNHP